MDVLKKSIAHTHTVIKWIPLDGSLKMDWLWAFWAWTIEKESEREREGVEKKKVPAIYHQNAINHFKYENNNIRQNIERNIFFFWPGQRWRWTNLCWRERKIECKREIHNIERLFDRKWIFKMMNDDNNNNNKGIKINVNSIRPISSCPVKFQKKRRKNCAPIRQNTKYHKLQLNMNIWTCIENECGWESGA